MDVVVFWARPQGSNQESTPGGLQSERWENMAQGKCRGEKVEIRPDPDMRSQWMPGSIPYRPQAPVFQLASHSLERGCSLRKRACYVDGEEPTKIQRLHQLGMMGGRGRQIPWSTPEPHHDIAPSLPPGEELEKLPAASVTFWSGSFYL